MIKLEDMVGKLNEFRTVVKEILFNSCNGALLGQGFIVDETLEAKGCY